VSQIVTQIDGSAPKRDSMRMNTGVRPGVSSLRGLTPVPRSHELLERFRRDFLGLDRMAPAFDLAGNLHSLRRIYLDTTATALMPRVVWQGLERYLVDACANSHTEAHRGGRDTTAALEESRRALGELVGYEADSDVVLFTSNGATGAINFLARALFPPELRSVLKRFPGGVPGDWLATLDAALGPSGRAALVRMLARPLVVVTRMEHHSNLLPWFEAVGRANVRIANVRADGTLDLDDMARILAKEGSRVRLVALTGVSNVTGIINPVHQVAALAHQAGAEILVDGAQWVPHEPVRMHVDGGGSVDYLALSGHKVYAPGSRGALVGKLHTFDDVRCVTDVGGGMVEYVSVEDFTLKAEVTAREEAGTPNITGTIAMGLVSEVLLRIGMDLIADAERRVSERLVERLLSIDGVSVYGSTDLARVPRAGVVSFNVMGASHELVASYLDDYANLAVRNGCFCAQPYVKLLLGGEVAEDATWSAHAPRPGMVRASLGPYSSEDDVTVLESALRDFIAHRALIERQYRAEPNGTYRHQRSAELGTSYRLTDAIVSWALPVQDR
jgi:cysteine desulfurase / selenocysteine lyase